MVLVDNWFNQANEPSYSSIYRLHLHNIYHDFNALLLPEELENLKKSEEFLSTYSYKTVTLDTTHTFVSLTLDFETGLWSISNFGKDVIKIVVGFKLGEDIIISVLDSGVWPESASYNYDRMSEISAR